MGHVHVLVGSVMSPYCIVWVPLFTLRPHQTEDNGESVMKSTVTLNLHGARVQG